MRASTIGIKVADGTFYPILEKGFTGKKRLTVTTVKDDQTRVQIDLYRGDGDTLAEAQYIGSLIIENVAPAPKGEAEIDLSIAMDEAGHLTAEANDRGTGESQSFSISMKTLSQQDTYDLPAFEVDETKTLGFEERPLTGETYRKGEAGRAPEGTGSGRRGGLLAALVVILGILLLAAAAYIVYRTFVEPRIYSLGEGKEAAVALPVAPLPEATAPAPTEPAASAAAPAKASAAPAKAPAAPAKAAAAPTAKGVTYRIKRGDTLWDISSTYYRNPWLYPKLARANSIRDPDLIIAGSKIFIPED